MTRVLVIDNYDSFTYNLVQYLGELGADPHVVRNDAQTVDELLDDPFDAVVISPGPGRPEDAGVSCELISRLGGARPVLGGVPRHHGLGGAFGGRILRR